MLKSYVYPISDCECGLLLNFDTIFSINPNNNLIVPSGDSPNVPSKTIYSINFTEQFALPSGLTNTTISPASYTISNSSLFVPQVSVKIKSTHNGTSQSLIKLTIKDVSNNILYTDYVKIVCAPLKNIQKLGSFVGDIGPNGGQLIAVDTTDLQVGMQVKDIATGVLSKAYIKTIISSNVIEITPGSPPGSNGKPQYFEFIFSIGCIVPVSDTNKYIYLDVDNNWTYKFNDKIIAKFIKTHDEDDVTVTLALKNTARLPDKKSPQSIPSVAMVKSSGIGTPNDKIGEIIFNNTIYSNEDISIAYSKPESFSTIFKGVIKQDTFITYCTPTPSITPSVTPVASITPTPTQTSTPTTTPTPSPTS